ncbi:MAG: ABC transporter substrate-binding protein [Herbaspirillum sp.]|nr:ABC transporter substrate-binding protein [Herbaspirillum sp.]
MRRFKGKLMAALLLSTLCSVALADQLADIKQRGVLVCGTLGTAEPFSFSNQSTREIQGYDVDFCQAVAKSLGVKLELKLISVAARIPELQQARVDILAANLGWSPERAQQIAFSDSYFMSPTKILVRKASGYKTNSDLAGKRVSAIKGSSPEIALHKVVPTAVSITFQDPASAFLALQQGKVEGLALNELTSLKFQAQVASTSPVVNLEPAIQNEAWGLGMRKDETAFVKYVNATLEAMEASGEAAQIFDKWLGVKSPYKLQRGFKIEPIKG